MTTPSDIVMAISMLMGLCGLVWVANNYWQNRGQRQYNPLAVLACIGTGLTMLLAPLAIICFKVHPRWWLLLPALVACVAVIFRSARRIERMKGGNKWTNSKVKLTLK